MMLFTLAQKVIINFGFFLEKMCHQDFSKITQSGHIGRCPQQLSNDVTLNSQTSIIALALPTGFVVSLPEL